jgi:hypothetical protein
MLKVTFSGRPERLDHGVGAQFAQALDYLLHQHLRRRGAGGDADSLLLAQPGGSISAAPSSR